MFTASINEAIICLFCKIYCIAGVGGIIVVAFFVGHFEFVIEGAGNNFYRCYQYYNFYRWYRHCHRHRLPSSCSRTFNLLNIYKLPDLLIYFYK